MNIDLVRFVLEADGFEVDAVAEAMQALERVAVFAPELVLMDIQMPGIDGLELTRCIKADPLLRHTVVVAFTAYAMKGDEAKMRASGCDGYISKPIDVVNFAATVRACLAARAAA